MTYATVSLLAAIGFGALLHTQPDAVAVARVTLERLVKGEFDAVVATFDEKVAAALPEAKLRATWEAVQGQVGMFRRAHDPRVASKAGLQIVQMTVEFERASLDMQVVLDGSGRIAGLGFRNPAPTTPFVDAPYVATARFTERNVTVDAGGWPLPGTLTMPNGDGPFPAVILVHGSGPGDRDQSLGPNKPFRDLAHGLATQGIAVLRYDKRTRQHALKVAASSTFTLNEETVEDAVAAVRLLRGQAGIDQNRVYVIGHSLGAMLAPRIAAGAGTDVAGLVIMAGPVRPLPQLLVDQTRYLAQADGAVSPEEQKQIEQFQRLADQVRDLEPGDASPNAAGISAPASYWIDIRDYDVLRAAAAVKTPMLIMQGGRDYQVTTDDFERWRSALAKRRDVTFKAYAALNHLFMPGTGPSLPAEYQSLNHVDEQVVRDIADWIRVNRPVQKR
jgi:dienelactone hydrolase